MSSSPQNFGKRPNTELPLRITKKKCHSTTSQSPIEVSGPEEHSDNLQPESDHKAKDPIRQGFNDYIEYLDKKVAEGMRKIHREVNHRGEGEKLRFGTCFRDEPFEAGTTETPFFEKVRVLSGELDLRLRKFQATTNLSPQAEGKVEDICKTINDLNAHVEELEKTVQYLGNHEYLRL